MEALRSQLGDMGRYLREFNLNFCEGAAIHGQKSFAIGKWRPMLARICLLSAFFAVLPVGLPEVQAFLGCSREPQFQPRLAGLPAGVPGGRQRSECRAFPVKRAGGFARAPSARGDSMGGGLHVDSRRGG
jgi:hypothetical protein